MKVRKKYSVLLKATLLKFTRENINGLPTEQGVYIISNKKNQVVHVGRSKYGRKGIRQRLKNHYRGISSFRRNFKVNGKIVSSEIFLKEYTFQYTLDSNDRTRALLENYTIGNLCPLYLGIN